MVAKPRRAVTREQSKQETREALIRAALALIPRRGLDVSLDDICDEAGFTRGAFYVHFADRDELLAVVMERVGHRVLDALMGAAGDADELAPLIERFVGALASGAYPLTRAGGVRPYQLLDACARSPAIRAQYVALVREAIARLAAGLRTGQRRRAVRKDLQADSLAALLVAAVIGVHTMVDLELPLDLGSAGASIVKLLGPRA
jgi:TetR/AcrR family transcriptional repressor of nem operon